MNRVHRMMLLFALVVTLLGGFSAPARAIPGRQASITLGMDPISELVTEGSEFPVIVYVDSGQEPIDGVQVTLGFDPDYLQVTEIVPGDDLPFVLPFPQGMPNGYDNSEGRIAYAAGAGLGVDSPVGRSDLFTVRFQARAPTTGTLVQFVDAAQPNSNAVVRAGYRLIINLVKTSIVTIRPSGGATLTSTPTPPLTPMLSPYPTLAPRYRFLKSPLPLILKAWAGDR